MRKFDKFKNAIMNDICHTLNAAGAPFVRASYSTMQVGSPSIVIFSPPPRHPKNCGAAIIVLNERRKLTRRQHHWWNLCSDIGLRLAIVFDIEDANEKLRKWGYLDEQKREGECAERRQRSERRREEHAELPARLGSFAVEED